VLHNRHETVVQLLLEQDDVGTDAALSLAVSKGDEMMLQLLWNHDSVSDKF
jgi:hypothetical protein